MASEAHPIAGVGEIPMGGVRLVCIKGREIGIFRTPHGYVALSNRCPHRGAPVCRGEVTGTFSPAAPKQYVWSREGEILRCPWHRWEFDLMTGEALFVPGKRIKTYRVEIEAEQLVIYV